jgi:hypothetical protein
MEKKLSTTVESLCRGLPNEFSIYLIYCRNLRFDEEPDYKFLKDIFKELFNKNGYETDYVYDWNVIAEYKKSEKDKNDIVTTLL